MNEWEKSLNLCSLKTLDVQIDYGYGKINNHRHFRSWLSLKSALDISAGVVFMYLFFI